MQHFCFHNFPCIFYISVIILYIFQIVLLVFQFLFGSKKKLPILGFEDKPLSKTISLSTEKQIIHNEKTISHCKFGKSYHKSTICFQSSRTSLGLDNARLPNLIFSANFDKQKTNNRADVFLMAPFIVW